MPNVRGPCFSISPRNPAATRSSASSQLAARCFPFSRINGVVSRSFIPLLIAHLSFTCQPPTSRSVSCRHFSFSIVRYAASHFPLPSRTHIVPFLSATEVNSAIRCKAARILKLNSELRSLAAEKSSPRCRDPLWSQDSLRGITQSQGTKSGLCLRRSVRMAFRICGSRKRIVGRHRAGCHPRGAAPQDAASPSTAKPRSVLALPPPDRHPSMPRGRAERSKSAMR